MKLILVLCALIIMVSPTVGCAEKRADPQGGLHAASEIFSVRIDAPRYAAEIGVITPSNKFLFLKQADLDCSGVDLSKDNLTIDLNVVSGVEWKDGKPYVSYVFNEAGSYKILSGDNLETELENSYSRVFQLSFSPSAKMDSRRQTQKEAGCKINGEYFEAKNP